MASRRGQSPSTNSSPPPPPSHRNGRQSSHRAPQDYNRNARASSGPARPQPAARRRSYPNEPKRSSHNNSPRQTIVLVVYRGASQGYVTAPVTFNVYRDTDTFLWEEIRAAFRTELEKPWRRILLFKTLKLIRPITFTANGVPKKPKDDEIPGEHEFMHAYHHPDHLRTTHDWIDWFVDFNSDPSKTYGLEFVEGLWADKIAAVAVIATIAIIVVSIVWCLKNGNLQTVFTVMGFVLTGVAAELALIALYYQVSLPG